MKYKPLVIGELVAEVPIIQGGMGVGVSLGNLAGAVAKEGGIGIISAAQIGYREDNFDTDPLAANLVAIRKEYKKARDIAPKGIIGYNIMVAMQHYEKYVKEAAMVGADIIISGAGLATELPQFIAGTKVKIAPIVSTAKSASVILKYWDRKYARTADLVVIEGPKAGGHLGFKREQLEKYDETTYRDEIKSIMEIVASYGEKHGVLIPIVVAGGLENAAQVEDVMGLGVDGVQVASRFVTTLECDVNEAFKQCYIDAKEEDIVIVTSPVGMPGRAIRNPFIKRIESGEKVPVKNCHRCLRKCNLQEIPYCITEALVNAAKGDVDQGLIFCGAYTYKADKIETVKEVITSLM
ncbi:MAG: nitronate monooxygenase family protein [Lachnospiraceae bacterium]